MRTPNPGPGKGTFNNNRGSTKSYDYVRDHNEATSDFDFVPEEDEISIHQESGTSMDVEMFDGSKIHLDKLSQNWDPTDKYSALARVQDATKLGKILTGLIYIEPTPKDLHTVLNTVDTPLNELKEEDLCPGQSVLNEINDQFR
jgi:2-oxoglutarate ferredoxin oxidoreductase subunit beta